MRLYNSIEDIERDFFPALKERREKESLRKLLEENPRQYGRQMAEGILQEVRKARARC